MTKQQKTILKNEIDELVKLASLENAHFCADQEKDRYIKNRIKPYMTWFEGIATELETLLELDDQENSYAKRYEMNELERRSFF